MVEGKFTVVLVLGHRVDKSITHTSGREVDVDGASGLSGILTKDVGSEGRDWGTNYD